LERKKIKKMIKYIQLERYFKYLYPFARWDSKINKILFTFDDSPNIKTTEIILKALSHYGTKAVFFCNGENVIGKDNLIKEIDSQGHIIASHGYEHIRIDKLSKKEIEYQVEKNNYLLSNLINKPIKYFRAPYGRFLNYNLLKTLKKNNMKNVMWSLLTYDYESNTQRTKKIISIYLKKNDIIVFHDNDKSAKLISAVIHYTHNVIKMRGFNIGEPEECLK